MSAVRPRPDEGDIAGEAAALAAAALTLARRFAAGATLWCVAPGAAHHAHHVAVEFVHPVIVGKRSLPALALPAGDAVAAAQAVVRPGDVVLAVGAADDPAVADLLSCCGARHITTVFLAGGLPPAADAADHLIGTGPDGGGGPVLAYHLLWELTHVVFEHPGLLAMPVTAGAGAGAALGSAPASAEPTGFLYPFIDADERDAGALLADLAVSAREKVAVSVELRDRTLAGNAEALSAAAAAMVERFAAGGRLLVFGNGGSSTSAAAAAAAFGRSVAAIDLSADPAVLTALGNDIGFDVVFARQVAALTRDHDVALGISTSGGSANVLAAFAAARARGLLTVGVAGYGGGAMAAGGDLDHRLVVEADSVHRIQEAQDALLRQLRAEVDAARDAA